MDGVLDAADGSLRAGLVQIDARTGEITRRIHVTVSDVGPVEAGAGAVWFVPDDSQARDLVERRDPATGRRVAEVTSDYNRQRHGRRRRAAVGHEGGRRRRRDRPPPQPHRGRGTGVYVTPAEQGGPAITSLAGDGDGVWVAGGARGDVAWVQAGRVARRIRIGEGTVNAVARAGNALWV